MRKFRVAGFSVFGLIVIAGAGLALFAIDFPRVPDNDMAPGLRRADLLLACRVCGAPRRGDTVWASSPDKPTQMRLLRVLGVPGDQVAVRKGQILVDGQPIPREPLPNMNLKGMDDDHEARRVFRGWNETLGKHHYPVIEEQFTPPSGEREAETLTGYFLVADRRTLTKDSREWGAIPRSSIRSTVIRILTAGDQDGGRQGKLP